MTDVIIGNKSRKLVASHNLLFSFLTNEQMGFFVSSERNICKAKLRKANHSNSWARSARSVMTISILEFPR